MIDPGSKFQSKYSELLEDSKDSDDAIIEKVKSFIRDDNFPCVGAKAAQSQKLIEYRVYRELASDSSTTSFYLDIHEYLLTLNLEDARVQSFVAIFPETAFDTEIEFERILWEQLGDLVELDKALNVSWASSVSDDPENPHFSLSIGGHPFFIVGMHPAAHRGARRSPYTMLVLNSHSQFEKLREDGRFDRLKAIIRKRDLEIHGSINPSLDDFGNTSEARQYSGRKITDDWECPIDHAALSRKTISDPTEADND